MENETKMDLGALLKYKRKLIKYGIIAVVVLAMVLVVFFKGYSNAAKKTEQKYADIIAELEAEVQKLSDPVAVTTVASKEVNINVINAEIRDIGELATIEYLYTDAGKFEDAAKIWGKNVPFTTKSFIAKWDGTIKAGVDISKVTAEENKATKEIIVWIPKAEILSHEIDSNSVETLDQKDGLFNKVTVDNVREFDAVSKDTMEKRAIENGILDKAFENAKEIISKLINTDVVKELEYKIIFKTIE